MPAQPIVVYCDGSSRGNPGVGGWAWYVHDNCWSAGSLPHTTNQQAELIALLMAVLTVPSDVPIVVKTDSQYARNVVTSWMFEWRRKGWRTKAGAPVANLTIVQKLDKALRNRTGDVVVEWVPGHAGVPGNEAADLRATRAADAEQRGKPVNRGPGWVAGPAPARQVSKSLSKSVPRRPAGGVIVSPVGQAARNTSVSAGVWARCPSCDTPINPSSLECRCSR